MLKEMGYKTTNKAFLAYYYPDYSDLHKGMIMNCTILEVDTDPIYVKNLVKKAYDVLSGPMPDPGINCEFCRWMQAMIENNFVQGCNNE